jgi:hypothetical protein
MLSWLIVFILALLGAPKEGPNPMRHVKPPIDVRAPVNQPDPGQWDEAPVKRAPGY